MRTWTAYAVQAWPTLVLIDPEGYIAHQVSGEGQVGYLAQGIATLLDAHGAKGTLVRGPLPVVVAGAAAAHRSALSRARSPTTPSAGCSPSPTPATTASCCSTAPGAVRDIIGTGEPARRDGSFGDAALQAPQGVAFWRGSLWIADTGNHRLRRADLEARELHTIGGPLRSPWDVAPYADDILVIAMAGTHQLWGYDPNYDRTGVVAGSGREGILDGPAVQADLAQPSGVASLGRLLGFVDAETSSLRVLAPADRGGVEVATVVGSGLFDWGDRDGSIGEARLQHPTGIAALEHGFVVADTFNHRLRTVHMETGTVVDDRRQQPRLPRRHRRRGPLLRAGRHRAHRRRADRGRHRQPRAAPRRARDRRRHEPAADGARAARLAGASASSPPCSPRTRSSPCSWRSSRRRAPTSTRAAPRADPAAPERRPGGRDRAARHRRPRRTLPAAVTVPHAPGAGSGTLRVEIRGAFCDDAQGEGAACRIAESAFVVPFTLEPGGRTRLTLE